MHEVVGMVFICIGTPKIVGDSVAPLTGDLLIKLGVNAYVYGTTERPVTGLNFDSYLQHIKNVHKGDTVIAIDSALGASNDVGAVKVIRGGVAPGAAIGKKHTKIGTYGILAQVGKTEGDETPMTKLMNVPYSLAESLAGRCAKLAMRMAKELALKNA